MGLNLSPWAVHSARPPAPCHGVPETPSEHGQPPGPVLQAAWSQAGQASSWAWDGHVKPPHLGLVFSPTVTSEWALPVTHGPGAVGARAAPVRKLPHPSWPRALGLEGGELGTIRGASSPSGDTHRCSRWAAPQRTPRLLDPSPSCGGGGLPAPLRRHGGPESHKIVTQREKKGCILLTFSR